MTQTTVTTLTDSVPTELIVATVIEEARPRNVIAPLVLRDILPLNAGKVWDKQVLPSTTAAAVAEGSDITAGARTTTGYEITVSEVGLSTDITDIAGEVAKVAGDLLTWAASQGRAIAQKITGDLAALFTALNSGTAIGTSTTNVTIANFIEAMYTLDAANAPGEKRCVLHPRQVYDLFAAIVAASGTVYRNLPELIREGRLPNGQPAAGFQGMLFGVPVYGTTECPAVNSSADRSGGMFTREALGFIQLRPVRVEYERNASARSTEIVVTTAYGVGEIVDGYGVPIETDA